MVLVLSFVFLLSVSEVISQCPPSSGIYLLRDGICYTNGSYFWDNSVNALNENISCVLPGTSLTTGQWVRVADPDDDPVDCNSNSASDPFRCTSVTSPDATISLYLAQGLSASQEGWYKCCLPTDCSTSGTNIIFANIFRYSEIESFIVANLPSDMTVYPQEYKLNCTKIGHFDYGISMSIGSTALASYTSCDDQTNTCPVPATAPSSLIEVNKTATTITVSWTALESSDADGYVVNVTSDTDTVQTVQVEGSSNNTITLNGLRIGTTYSITVRAYQQLLGPASSAISVFTHCQQEGIYLAYNGNCYPNGSYFFDNSVNAVTEAISCVLPGTSLTTGQWVRVADPDDPVDCNSNSDSDPFRCTNVTSPDATINLYLAQGLTTTTEGWYKCCLPTDCSDPNTNIIIANIFRFAEIESFTVAGLPSDMTVYPQEYKLNCTKIGFYSYGISMSIGSTALASYTNCDDRSSTCPGTVLVSSNPNTLRYTVDITWDGMTVGSGSISQSTTGDQMYQCVLDNPSGGIYLLRDGICYTNGSYFWGNTVNAVTENISCVLPDSNLTTGEWVRVADSDDPVDCDNTNNDPFCCANVTSPNATISLYLAQGLPAAQEGWYKCCLPTDCSDPNTNIIFANIFRFSEIESLTVADLPSDMTIYPQEYQLNCIKIGHYGYNIRMNIGSTALASYTNCDDRYSTCPGTELVSFSNTLRYTVNITWDGMNVSSGSISQSTTGDQMYQCAVEVTDQPTRTRDVIVKVPATAPSLTEVNKTTTTITVSWTAVDSSDADGYVVNVTSGTDTVQTVQVEGSSNNTITLDGLRELTTYSITVRAYQQLLGPASSAISVFTHICQQEGIYLAYNGNCYPNESYFWDNIVNAVTKAISCVLLDSNLTTGQWVRVADPDDPVDCNSNSASDPFHCTNVTSPAAISLYLVQGLSNSEEGWYKCCLPTDCSDPNTNIIFANIFRYAEIESFTVVDLPSDMTVYPQEYKLNCIKIGFDRYDGISMNIGSTALASYTNCDDRYSTCPGTVLVSSNPNTLRYTVNITWDGMNVSSGSISPSTTGDQMYQCVLDNPSGGNDRTRTLTIKVPATAPSSLTEVNKTATTITVSWTALDSSDADGYVVNVTSDTDTVQTVPVEGSSNNTITLNGLNIETTYNITVRAYQQLLGPASTISVHTSVINSINWTLVSSITQLNNTQYRIDCITTTDINPSTDVYWLMNGVMKSNSNYSSIDVLTYNNTLLVYPDPLGVSVNVTCIAMIGGVNYSQSVILHGMIIL
uniref:Fibronectin type-III domain-containing protein n=1 Tax=Amphimedon queenslandica TaxID=400682 RepID=A0A1X7T9D2_AMPQE